VTRITVLIAAALAFTAGQSFMPANAQAIRTFVSTAGSDSNPCSITQPCRHFQAAVSATGPGGEVDALDPGNYGSFTIGQAISIEGQGWSYVAPLANGAAITINAHPSDKINIRGVSLNGSGVPMAYGIEFNTGADLNVQNSVIQNFSITGIAITPFNSSQILVSNTLISGSNYGIDISPVSFPGAVTGVLDHVVIEGNGNGLRVITPAPKINVTVSDSIVENNVNNGIFALSGGPSLSVMVRNSTIADNGADGLLAQNAGSIIRVTRSTITGNGAAWATSSGGVVTSYGDNNIDGNTNTNTEPPNTLTYK
jgi:hypothetical protein